MSSCENQDTSPVNDTTTTADAGSATADAGSATAGCPTCSITSETVNTSLPNRARTKVGVGEEVSVTFSLGAAEWTVSGGGSMYPSSGATVTFRAGDSNATATVTATGSGCTSTITFTVVEPDSVGMVHAPGHDLRHTNGQPDCGFLGQPYLRPNDVSFEGVEIRELNSAGVGTGYYRRQGFNGAKHQPASQDFSDWYTVRPCEPGEGSPGNCLDQIYSGYTGYDAEVGTMVFPITWQFRVGALDAKSMPNFEQRAHVDSDGRCTISKGGNTETNEMADATSAW
jgi:hypothetical protein